MPAFIIYTRFITLHVVIMLNLPKAAITTSSRHRTSSQLLPFWLHAYSALQELLHQRSWLMFALAQLLKDEGTQIEKLIFTGELSGEKQEFSLRCTVSVQCVWLALGLLSFTGRNRRSIICLHSDFPHPIRTAFQSIPVVGRQDNLIDFQRCGLFYATFQQERHPRRKHQKRGKDTATGFSCAWSLRSEPGWWTTSKYSKSSDEGWPENPSVPPTCTSLALAELRVQPTLRGRTKTWICKGAQGPLNPLQSKVYTW